VKARSRGAGEVYHPTYRGRDGKRREAATWSAAHYDTRLKKKVRRNGFRTSNEAWRWLRAVHAAKEAGNRGGDGVTRRLSDAWDLVATAYALKGRRTAGGIPRMRRYCIEIMGDPRISEIEEHDVERLATTLLDPKGRDLAPASVNRILSLLRHGFRLAARRWRGTVSPPHVQLLKEDNVRRQYAPWDEVERIVAALPAPLAGFVRTVALTGWRPWKEVATRTWADVDWKEGRLYLHRGQGKTDVAKACPLDPDLRPVLERMRAYTNAIEKERGEPIPLVVHVDGFQLRSFAARTIEGTAWRDALKAAKSPKDRILYDLCKTAVRDLIRAGVPEHQAQVFVGKKTPSVFRRYDIVDDGDLDNAASRLSEYRKGLHAEH
jgi:hypothetical protein